VSIALSEQPPANAKIWTNSAGHVWKYYAPGSSNVPMFPAGTVTRDPVWVVSPPVPPPVNPLTQQNSDPRFRLIGPLILVLVLMIAVFYLKYRNGSSKSEQSLE